MALVQSDASPLVTVVVVFYDRKEFLGAALGSLTRQSLPSSRFEVVVVGPGDPREFLSAPFPPGARFIPFGGPSLAGKLAAGIRAANGEIIAFLEDDDRYTRTRLEHVVGTFLDNPDLTYYQNGYLAISDTGKTLGSTMPHGRAMVRWARRGQLRMRSRPSGKDLGRLVAVPAGFNVSSIAVRAGPFRNQVEMLEHVDILGDTLLLYVALCQPGLLILDPIQLTEVRVHRSSLSRPQVSKSLMISQMQELLVRASPDLALMQSFVSASGPPAVMRAVQGLRAATEALLCLRGRRSPISARARVLLTICARLDTFEVRNRWPLAPLSLLSLTWPSLAKAIYSLVASTK